MVKEGYLRPLLRTVQNDQHRNPSAHYDFFVIKCTADGPREREFIRLVSGLAVKYALRKDEYDSMDTDRIMDISRKVRMRFRTSETKAELGELILFALLESEMRAPQIVNKMALKMHGDVPILGSDAVHIRFDGKEVQLFFGEAKMIKDIMQAITRAVRDISNRAKDHSKSDLEIDLVCNYIDDSKFKNHIDQIKEILNPYSSKKSDLRVVNPIFIGSDWDSVTNIDWSSLMDDLEEGLAQTLANEIDNICHKCEDSMTKHNIKNPTYFFFIPFTNVDTAGELFREMI